MKGARERAPHNPQALQARQQCKSDASTTPKCSSKWYRHRSIQHTGQARHRARRKEEKEGKHCETEAWSELDKADTPHTEKKEEKRKRVSETQTTPPAKAVSGKEKDTRSVVNKTRTWDVTTNALPSQQCGDRHVLQPLNHHRHHGTAACGPKCCHAKLSCLSVYLSVWLSCLVLSCLSRVQNGSQRSS